MFVSGEASASLTAHFGASFGDTIVVAVSGGSDSTALLHAMHDWGGAPLKAVTVNHGLRPEAAAEARGVAAICAGLGISHHILTWQRPHASGNLAAAAREARYALMADWAAGVGAYHIALGHTQDDLAETLLMRLARRAGLDGLAGMAARRKVAGVTLHRPLLGVSRATLRDDLRARGVGWIDDPSNVDETARRVQARRALQALTPAGITPEVLADVAGYLAEARTTMGHYAALEADRLLHIQEGDIVIDRAGFCALRADIARRILQAALRWITGAAYGARGPDMARLYGGIVDGQGGTLAGCRVTLSGGDLRITRELAALNGIRARPGALWDNRWQVSGPDITGAHIGALGRAGRVACPDWRASGLPAASIEASPGVWQDQTLLAAPVAGFANGWSARPCRGADDLRAMLLSH